MDLFRRRRIEGHIDMTPMIDTLLQLFLIFMVGTTLATSTIDLNLPRAKATAASGEVSRLVVISMDTGNRVYLDDRPIPRDRLRAALLPLLRDSSGLTVHLRADRKLIYEQVLQVMVEIKKAGVTKILLVYTNDDTPQAEAP